MASTKSKTARVEILHDRKARTVYGVRINGKVITPTKTKRDWVVINEHDAPAEDIAESLQVRGS